MLHIVILVIQSKQLIQHKQRLLILLLIAILQFWVCPGNCLNTQFYQRDFSDVSNISLHSTVKNITLQSSTAVLNSSKYVWLLPLPPPTSQPNLSINLSGWMSYSHAIPFLDSSNEALSFNTSFTFKLITPGNYGECPSGMAFFILSKQGSPSSTDVKYFGLADDTTISPATNPFFAVEFDTRKSPESNDPSASHIGIDISSVNSANITDTSNNSSNPYYPELYLYNNYTFKAWIAYEASSKLTKVWMTNRSTDYSNYLNPPHDSELMSILQLNYDLSSTFAANNMYIGFSASTISETGMLGVAIYSWYFSIGKNNTNPGQSGKRLEIIIPVAIIAFLSIASAVSLALYCKCRQKCLHSRNKATQLGNTGSDPFSSAVALPRYSYQEMQSSTNCFDNNSSLIGEGGFSKVYRGRLADGSLVAIKRLKDGVRKEAEFTAELKLINTIRHRNILNLQGWCYEKGETLLVYKFMSNGSLAGYIFSEKRGLLDGHTRLRILLGVARALEYLHFGLGDCVLHRDVKAANVLLTDDFEAVLGDFGLARLIKHNETVSATMAGTVGYIAPEVVLEGKVTDKADVYSFGVLALEVACGRKVINRDPEPGLQRQNNYLVEHVFQLQKRGSSVEALDPIILRLESSKPESDASQIQLQWMRILELALHCCHQNPESRPNMRYVNQEIDNVMLLGADVNQEINELSVGYPFLDDDQTSNDPSWNTVPLRVESSTSTLTFSR